MSLHWRWLSHEIHFCLPNKKSWRRSRRKRQKVLDSGLCGCLSIVQGSHDLCPKREQKRFTNWGKRRKRLSVGSGNCVQRWLAAGQKRKRWKWLSLEGPQSKAWKGRARLQTELGFHPLDCLIESFRSDICREQHVKQLVWKLKCSTRCENHWVVMLVSVLRPLRFFCQKWKIVANTLLRTNVWPPTAAL